MLLNDLSVTLTHDLKQSTMSYNNKQQCELAQYNPILFTAYNDIVPYLSY
jgi:hypothetical protein